MLDGLDGVVMGLCPRCIPHRLDSAAQRQLASCVVFVRSTMGDFGGHVAQLLLRGDHRHVRGVE